MLDNVILCALLNNVRFVACCLGERFVFRYRAKTAFEEEMIMTALADKFLTS